jgi:hypothetical protein
MNFKFDKVYVFKCDAKFLPLSDSVVCELFKDGRVASKFLEHSIPLWFTNLEFVDATGYDHINKKTGTKYDLKGFTENGANYAPSNMIGASRKINLAEMHSHAKTINYIFSDITEFPIVRIVFKKGTDIIKKYPNGKIPKSEKNVLFK